MTTATGLAPETQKSLIADNDVITKTLDRNTSSLPAAIVRRTQLPVDRCAKPTVAPVATAAARKHAVSAARGRGRGGRPIWRRRFVGDENGSCPSLRTADLGAKRRSKSQSRGAAFVRSQRTRGPFARRDEGWAACPLEAIVRTATQALAAPP